MKLRQEISLRINNIIQSGGNNCKKLLTCIYFNTETDVQNGFCMRCNQFDSGESVQIALMHTCHNVLIVSVSDIIQLCVLREDLF
jgi:hypothetical protein